MLINLSLIGMNGSMPRTRRTRNSSDCPLTKPMVSDLGYEIRDAVLGEKTCTAPACGYQGGNSIDILYM